MKMDTKKNPSFEGHEYMETGGYLWLYEIFEAFGHCQSKLLNMEMILASYILWGVSK